MFKHISLIQKTSSNFSTFDNPNFWPTIQFFDLASNISTHNPTFQLQIQNFNLQSNFSNSNPIFQPQSNFSDSASTNLNGVFHILCLS